MCCRRSRSCSVARGRGSEMSRISSLDGLRAFACLCVIIGHSLLYLQAHKAIAFDPRVLSALNVAPLGVGIFFVLSGFLITTLLRRELEASGTVSLRGFYARRTFRILPALYAFLAITAVLLTWRGLQAPAF